MPMFSNIEEVGRWLDSVVAEFSFNCPGINESIGYDSGIGVAEGIQERAYMEQKGAQQKWPINSPDYMEWKREHYGMQLTNFRTTQMLSMNSLTANITTTDGGKTVVMNYGTGEPPSSSLTGYLNEEDDITDKEKAAIAHEDGRPFFEIDQRIAEERVMPIVSEGLTKYLQERANK